MYIYIYILALAPSNNWMGALWILSLTGSDQNVSITNSFCNFIRNYAKVKRMSLVLLGPGRWPRLDLLFLKLQWGLDAA